ncbi:MAG TPA: alpha-amylase family glycosyl hydrolase [Thermomicrobiales bacterium]|nr:alpha-amylase family glycosyl hydrolase [Thermomicrobiales bacterium]
MDAGETGSGVEIGDWWRRAVVYQIYPRSFQDSNGDGIGDLQGIIDRLDYVNDGTDRSLGVDAIWLSPTFPSPMKDFGYDVSDYCDVHPDFGDLAAMDRLIDECHRRGIRLLLDWAPNHSSDQHPWFIESRASRDSPRRDWYYWRDPKPDGAPPNNWRSVFGGPAWTIDARTGQYYLHSFLKEQPDLNWRNPEVVQAMHDVLRFWMERGVDGFRIDVLGMIVKHPDLPDNPINPDYEPSMPDTHKVLDHHSLNYPDVFDAVAGIRRVLDEYPGRMAVGEVFGPADVIARYHGGEALDGLHLAFNFQLLVHDGVQSPWDSEFMRGVVSALESSLPDGAQPCYALGNHDQPRLASRHNHDGRGQERSRAAALLLLGVRSTPFLYYGEELGMVDVDIPEDRLQDPARFYHHGRDPERTPMQWDASAGRGFTEGEPWLPFGPVEINVAAQQDDPGSLLSLYRDALRIRRDEPSLHAGELRDIDSPTGTFVFVRHAAGARAIHCAINTTVEPIDIALPEGAMSVLLATDRALDGLPVTGSFTVPALGAAWIG